MAADDRISRDLLRPPSDAPPPALERAASDYHPLDAFWLARSRSYQQQFGGLYFLRLTKIRPAVEKIAEAEWHDQVIGDETVRKADRVLDVRQGQLCWVVGTVYVDMPLKPNILEDVSKDKWLSIPISGPKYYADVGDNVVMLEDDSGRIVLTGKMTLTCTLVTGCVIAVLGTENADAQFEVIDMRFPDLPPQPERWALSRKKPLADNTATGPTTDQKPGSKIAIVSGLAFSSTDASYALELDLLVQFLLGEALDSDAQREVSRISRLIVAGNSISTTDAGSDAAPDDVKKTKKYGYDASLYNPLPTQLLDDFLAQLLPSIPVTLLPGSQDPAEATYPQQPIHPVMLKKARAWTANPAEPQEPGWLDLATNPWEAEVDGWRVLGTGGQNVDDVYKYLDSEDRLGMMEAMCTWRCSAPTAPDTLWCYPFRDNDPFVMTTCPHLFFAGCQPHFSTKIIRGPDGQKVRLLTIPTFSTSKELVLVDSETLEISRIHFSLP